MKKIVKIFIPMIIAMSLSMCGENNINYSLNSNINKNEAKESENSGDSSKEEVKKEDTNIVSVNRNMKDSAIKNSVSAKDVRKMLEGTYEGELKDEKVVFLTFDDGPSKNTPLVLDILKKNNINATFFVLGEQVEKEENKEIVKQVVESNNALANHSYTHDFAKIYPNNSISLSILKEEYFKTEKALKNILGENYSSNIFRFPGGEVSRKHYNDTNLPEFNKIMEENNIVSIDWNALNRDAEGKKYSNQQLIDNTIKSTGNKKHVVVLMHDAGSKKSTVDSLQGVIDYYKQNNYKFMIIG